MEWPRETTSSVDDETGSSVDGMLEDVKRKQPSSEGPVKKQRPNSLSLWQVTGVSETKELTGIASVLPKGLRYCVTQVVHFFLFMYERQMIWERRNKEEVFPYTESDVLQKYSFTNNYRDLDRGTNYFRAHVLNLWDKHNKKDEIGVDHLSWIELVLWASVCYRLVNRISTFEAFGCIPEISEWTEFSRFLRQQHEKDVKLFTDAHIVSGLRPYMGSMNALYAANGRQVTNVSRKILKYCRQNDLEGCFQAVQTIKGAGRFIAWQVVCDLMESQCLKPCTENDWAELGPGAKAGINRIFGEGKRHSFTHLELAMRLQLIQDVVYQDLGITFPKWNGLSLTLKNIEHPLCEFSKYTVIQGKLIRGEKVLGQRLKKSRTELDLEKSCRCGNSEDVLFCDKCLNAFCQGCVIFSDSAYWVCPRCIKFESISFRNETVNRVEMKEPILSASQTDAVVPLAALRDFLEQKDAEEVDDADCCWAFTSIEGHRMQKGKNWEVLVHWEDGSRTWEPLSSIGADDPVTVSAYANTHGLLETDGWKRFKSKLVREDQQFCVSRMPK